MIKREIQGKLKQHFNFICSKYEFRFNIVSARYEYRSLKKGKQIKSSEWLSYDDRVRSKILLELMEQDLDIPANKVDIFIESEEISPEFDPFSEYFNNLPEWDGKTDYINQLSKTIKTDNDERFEEILKRFLVGTLDCLLEEDNVNDVCLVFQSGQGTGKTRWMRSLVPPSFRKNYFNETNIDTRNKDHVQWLSQFWFIHLDELESLNSNDINAMKSFITRQRISLRAAYGRYQANYVRRASFLGSVNHDKFLSDTTGNRRWLVFKTFKIDYEHNIDIDKLWSQVFSLWSSGYKHWFDIDEIKEINSQNEKFRDISLEEELIIENFEFVQSNDAKGEFMSSSDVMSKISEIKPKLTNKLRSNVIGKVLTLHKDKYGGIKKRPKGVSKYYLKFIGIEPDEPKETIGNEKKTAVEPDDLPF